MAGVLDFEDKAIAKIRRLAADWEKYRLQTFPCPQCEHALNMVDKWTCGCCGQITHQPEPGGWAKLTGSYRKEPIHTVLDGCADPYCDHPKQTGVKCLECSTVLVFDRSAYMLKQGEKKPVVAQQYQPGLADMGLFGVVLALADEVLPDGVEGLVKDQFAEYKADAATGVEAERVRREAARQTAMREARQGLDPEKPENVTPEPDDDAEWVKSAFDMAGFSSKKPRP